MMLSLFLVQWTINMYKYILNTENYIKSNVNKSFECRNWKINFGDFICL